MFLAVALYVVFTLLATGGLFAILRYQYDTRTALAWSSVCLLAFVALAALIVWVVVRGTG